MELRAAGVTFATLLSSIAPAVGDVVCSLSYITNNCAHATTQPHTTTFILPQTHY